MRILHIGKYYSPFSGGIENFMQDLVAAQVRSGLEVAVLVHNHDASIFRIVEQNCDGARVCRVPCPATLLYAPVSPLFLPALLRIAREFMPDIVHVHMPNTSGLFVFFVPSLQQVPLVVHWHSDVVQSGIDTRLKFAYPFYQPFERQLLKKAAAVIATSPPYLETSRVLKKFRTKSWVIPLGIDDQSQQVPDSARQWAENIWGQADVRFLCVGRLTYYKGHQTLVRAAVNVPGARIIIAGQGALMGAVGSVITCYGLDDRVTLAGHLAPHQLAALFTSAHCLVLPSLERTEAFGLVLLEAMRAEKPAIVFDVKGSGMGWVVKNRVTGFKVAPGDEMLLAAAMKQVADHPQLARRMGQNARVRFESTFHIHRVCSAVNRVYAQTRFTFQKPAVLGQGGRSF